MPASKPADREPARTDPEAKARFLRVLGNSLSAVSTTAIWRVAPLTGSLGAFNTITVPDVVPLRRRSGERIYLRSTIQYEYRDHPRYPGERKVSTLFYAHTVGQAEALKPQLYSWEWNYADERYPHLHVRRADPAYHGLGKLHIPTGRVYFEDVLRFLVEEHDVAPACDDWSDKIGDSRRRVATYSTWGGGEAPL